METTQHDVSGRGTATALETEMTQVLGDYHRHLDEAAAHLRAVADPLGELDEDGEPYPPDPMTPDQHQTAAGVHATLAQAAATTLAALATLRTSRTAAGQ